MVTLSETNPSKTGFVKSKRRVIQWGRFRNKLPLYMLILPTIVLLAVFFYYPAIRGILTSFQYIDVRFTEWVGLENYERLFTDRRLIASFNNLLFLTVFNIGVVLTLPLMVAVFIHNLRSLTAQYWWRVAFIVPIVVPGVATILVWRWMYSPEGGINILLRSAGLGELARAWLGNSDTVMLALAFTNFPWVAGINFLIYYAGLQEISTEITDAAKVDGASTVRTFFSVQLPLLQPQMRLLALITVIFWLRSFELPLIMTNGGPGFSSMVPGLQMYYSINRDYDLGYGSAIGTVLLVLVLAVTLVQLRVTRSRNDVF